MRIKSVRALVYEWTGQTVPPLDNFCANAMDMIWDDTRGRRATPSDAQLPPGDEHPCLADE